MQHDPVDYPAHYNAGKFKTIDVIEDVVQFAPNSVLGGQQWQVLKYVMHRLWLKDDPLQDAKKARVYLNRLIATLESGQDGGI